MSREIMKVTCRENGESIERTVRFSSLSIERLHHYYQELSKFDVLFHDYVRGDPDAFIKTFISIDAAGQVHPKGLIWEVDDVGILYLTDIRPGFEAEGHYTFWDSRFRGREDLIRQMLRFIFDEYGFHRIYTRVPLYSPPALKAAERIGFVKEGRLREATLYKGKWFDMNIYSILNGEV